MGENNTLDIRGLKCDSPTCDFADDSIQLEEYEAYINKPCPLCGSPLLTQEDYNQVQNILAMVAMANTLPPADGDTRQFKTTFELNGTGEITASVELYSQGTLAKILKADEIYCGETAFDDGEIVQVTASVDNGEGGYVELFSNKLNRPYRVYSGEYAAFQLL